jgi:hypothetical protein
MNPQFPLCAQVGMLHGLVAGFMYGLLQQGNCCAMSTAAQLAYVAVLLSGLALLTSLFVLCVICRYTFASVWLGALINAVIVAFVVVFALQAIGASVASPIIGILLGIVIGLIIGWILCRLCDVRPFLTAAGG